MFPSMEPKSSRISLIQAPLREVSQPIYPPGWSILPFWTDGVVGHKSHDYSYENILSLGATLMAAFGLVCWHDEGEARVNFL